MILSTQILLPAVLSGFGLALILAFLRRLPGRYLSWLAAALPLGIALLLLSRLPDVAAGAVLVDRQPWIPTLGVELSFFADGFSLLMGLIVTGIGALIMLYAGGYMANDPKIGRFFVIILFFMAAMLGVVFADNIILLFVFWELTSISSYLLIGFKHEYESSRNAALQALVVTGGGGLVLLAGLILLGEIGGSWQLTELLQQGELVRSHSLYTPALILILIGCFTKSAQFPFHFWLPNAMAAPTPVSAYLHSATMVKAGVYLLARLFPILGGTPLWSGALLIFGGATGLLGGWLAWQQRDLKKIMAYTTISALGLLVFLLGVGGKIGVKAMVLFLLVHSLYKGALFMTAGSIDHETGTRDVNLLGGLLRPMPLTALGVGLAALSMAGIPPLLGFIGKELIYEATVELESSAAVLTAVAFAINFFNVAAAAILLALPFLRPRQEEMPDGHVHEAPRAMWLGPVVLGLIAVLLWIFAGSHAVSETFLQPAVSAVYGQTVAVELHPIPPYWSIVPLLSLLTIAAGLIFFAVHGRFKETAVALDGRVARFGPEKGFWAGLDGLLALAKTVTERVQNGYMRHYLIYIVTTLLLLVGAPLILGATSFDLAISGSIRFYELVIVGVTLLATVMVIVVRSRLAAVAALGVVGYGVSLLYLDFYALDLAMTQFSVETLTVILFVLVLYRLPEFVTLTGPTRRVRDGVIAVFAGTLAAVMVLVVTSTPHNTEVSEFYAANSYTAAKGLNVVNVILVDFRGLDTMVEVTVLSVAAMGVFILLRRAAVRRRDEAGEGASEMEVNR